MNVTLRSVRELVGCEGGHRAASALYWSEYCDACLLLVQRFYGEKAEKMIRAVWGGNDAGRVGGIVTAIRREFGVKDA